MDNGPPDALYGQWVHSNEEDTDDELVFRPPDYRFPPSRGRAAFELNSDKSYVGAGIGPTDISKVTRGRWKLENDDGLRILVDEGDRQRVLEIVSLTSNRLAIRKKR